MKEKAKSLDRWMVICSAVIFFMIFQKDKVSIEHPLLFWLYVIALLVLGSVTGFLVFKRIRITKK